MTTLNKYESLPLALKVLGSFLNGRGLDEWISEVERLQQIPENEILKKLEPSFTGLHNIEQKIFLDIACFFSGKKKDSVTRILESFHFCPAIGIKVLMEKCLITILKGRIIIHQLIQEMGWHIVRREASYNARICSRLWKREDICPVLERNLGTDKIEGISLHLTNEEEVNFGGKAFMQMTSLRFLKFRNAYVCQGPEFLPDELRWIDWHVKGDQLDLGKLKYMNLSHSQKLIRTPGFSVMPNLERLVLEECTSLVQINFSIGDLGKLVLLNLKNCRNLKTLPKRIRLEKLEILVLSGCSKLRTFPEIEEKMNRLAELYLGATALSELSASVENLSGVEELRCTHTAIQTIPSSMSLLKNLKHLSLRGCNALSSQNLSGLCSLIMLDLSDCNISDGGILSTLGFLPSLEGLTGRSRLAQVVSLNLEPLHWLVVGGLRVYRNFLQV
ncbi:hypothetical protein KY290_032854 [Solanum tuberosum]|uniref:Uncharacterized protein n=1 Tax=Solanum tuberosum TaxID=4113 RepID=A0ABQ7UD77_SOLTU|nr:hypothetical protein KY290_032854 [Solanum tuberosum]